MALLLMERMALNSNLTMKFMCEEAQVISHNEMFQ